MVFGGASRGESRRELSRHRALQGVAPDEERQQADKREQKNKNGGRQHRWRPGGYGLTLTAMPPGSSSPHSLRRYDAETEMRSCFEK